ncbi:MAG: helix-hairpin-helix domain-containing protein [Microscillaceae bacterium]
MNKTGLWLGLGLTFLAWGLPAQEYPRREVDLDEFILELFPVQDEDLDYEEIYEALFQYYRQPLHLNQATREELQSLYVLSERQINALLAHREQFGDLVSIYELQTIPDFDLGTIYKLLPFAQIRDTGRKSLPLWKRILEEENNYLLLRYERVLETQRGFTDQATPSTTYLGSPGRIYARFRVSHPRDFSLGFTLEKDNGEQIIWDAKTRRYLADFISFHAFFENKGRFKKIALGDYQIQAGQGLVLSGGFGVGKGAETVLTVRRNQLGIRPYTSSLETGFFRGAAATYAHGPLQITGFYSRVRRDGTLSAPTDSTEAEFEAFIETLRTTGFHRTESEIGGKGRFVEQTLGGHLLFQDKNKAFQIGLTGVYTHYNLPFRRNVQSRKDSIVDLFEFRGQTNYNLGLHFNYHWQNFSFFGEAARSKSGGLGAVGGLVASLAPNVEFAYLIRHYDRDFHTFFGSALGEGTRNINEQGMYWGIKITPIVRKLKIAAYYDRFRFPWLRFRVDAPSEGYEWLGRITYFFSRATNVYFQYRHEAKDRNLNSEESETVFRPVLQGNRRNYLLNLDYRAKRFFRLQSRVQFSTFDFAGRRTSGLALVQDLGLDLGRLKLDVRFALFDTEDFDNRQYVYERDVLWAFSIPAYSGQGLRSYVLLRYQFTRKLDLWLRYARFDYRNQDTISSSSDLIEGNTRSELKVQVRVKF